MRIKYRSTLAAYRCSDNVLIENFAHLNYRSSCFWCEYRIYVKSFILTSMLIYLRHKALTVHVLLQSTLKQVNMLMYPLPAYIDILLLSSITEEHNIIIYSDTIRE